MTDPAHATSRSAGVRRAVIAATIGTIIEWFDYALYGSASGLIINKLFKPTPGATVLIHTAAAGVGIILSQWSKHLGATVLGTVGSPQKARIAQAHGCDHPILYREQDFVEAARKIVPGGVDVVFDGVGKDTFVRSLGCVRPFGLMVK